MRLKLAILSLTAFLCGGAEGQIATPQSVSRPESPALSPQPPMEPLFRHQDVQGAWSASQSTLLPVLVYVTANSCRFCKKMHHETLSHPQIYAVVAAHTEPVSVNASVSPKLAKHLGVRSFPTTLIISPQGQLLLSMEGFVEPGEFADQVWPVLKQADADRRAVQQASRPRQAIARRPAPKPAAAQAAQ